MYDVDNYAGDKWTEIIRFRKGVPVVHLQYIFKYTALDRYSLSLNLDTLKFYCRAKFHNIVCLWCLDLHNILPRSITHVDWPWECQNGLFVNLLLKVVKYMFPQFLPYTLTTGRPSSVSSLPVIPNAAVIEIKTNSFTFESFGVLILDTIH